MDSLTVILQLNLPSHNTANHKSVMSIQTRSCDDVV